MLNPAILKPLWRVQTVSWQDLAQSHLDAIDTQTTAVAYKLLDQTATKFRMTALAKNTLERRISEFAAAAKAKAVLQLREECHRNATMALQTMNPQFHKGVRSARFTRFQMALLRYQVAHPAKDLIARLPVTIAPQSTGFGSTSASGTSFSWGNTTANTASVFGNVPADPEANRPSSSTTPSQGLSGTSDAIKQGITVINSSIAAQWTVVDGTSNGITALFNEMHSAARSQNVEEEIHDILKAYYDGSSSPLLLRSQLIIDRLRCRHLWITSRIKLSSPS